MIRRFNKSRRAMLIGVAGVVGLLARTSKGTTVISTSTESADVTLHDASEKQRKRFDITDYGATLSASATKNGLAIRSAMADAAAVKGIMWIPAGTFQFDYFVPMSDVTIDGEGTLQLVPAGTAQSGVIKPAGAGRLENFHVRNIRFDGGRVPNPKDSFNSIISIEVGTEETVNDVSFLNCHMQDAQDHFIRFIASAATGVMNNIRVDRCVFITTPAKRSLGGSANVVSFDAVRFEQIWDYKSNGNGYGAPANFKHIWITNCYAESIRTLADIKRGASNFTVSRCRTKNMYDCHHSVDGSFNGTVSGNICEVDPNYAGPSTFTNFIEVQGEHIDISDNICFGAGKINSGILVTDYGRLQENGRGHRSVNVRTRNNKITGIKGNAFRILNGVECTNENNYCEDVGGHVATIESGTGRTDGVNRLVAVRCRQAGNRSKNAALGVRFAGMGHTKGINPDENRQDYLYCPGFALADVFANFSNEDGYEELNPNELLEIVGSKIKKLNADAYPKVTIADSSPSGVANAITLTDDSTTQLQTVYVNVSATVGNRVYVRSYFKKNTARACGFVIEERDASGGFVASSFFGTTSPPVEWTAYIIGHKVMNARTASLRIGYMPAAAGNDPTQTGSTDVAKLQISRIAIGH